MLKVKCSNIAVTACLVLAVPLISAGRPPASMNRTMTAATSMGTAWKPETLTGKITNVYPGRNLVVVETNDGVPFDILVTTNTQIKSADRGLDLKQLKEDMNQNVSITFTPERRGDVATLIQING